MSVTSDALCWNARSGSQHTSTALGPRLPVRPPTVRAGAAGRAERGLTIASVLWGLGWSDWPGRRPFPYHPRPTPPQLPVTRESRPGPPKPCSVLKLGAKLSSSHAQGASNNCNLWPAQLGCPRCSAVSQGVWSLGVSPSWEARQSGLAGRSAVRSKEIVLLGSQSSLPRLGWDPPRPARLPAPGVPVPL